MTLLFAIIAVACLAAFIALMFYNKKLEGQVAAANQETERLRQHYESETQRVYGEAQVAVADAQKQIDQQFTELKQESERLRQHYETETRKSQDAAAALVAKTIKDFEPLRKFEKFRDAEAEVQRQLADALKEATSLRAEAQSLMEQAKVAATDERAQAVQRAKALRDQADALLNQATRDAGRIMAEAEKRAEQIGGDAYRALREKEMLEQAAEAMRNVVDGYGDRYLVPTHSLLDDLAAEFGYAAAGESLKSARDLTRRMVVIEPSEAATCEYVEAPRRRTAIQFVIHAFNGRVDATLSRVKHDNYGTLEQEIRDAFSLVNKDGKAFRDARILPAYLDARLAELKWAVIVQEMARQRQEEQRVEREKMRDAALAKREQAEKLREAEKLEELKKLAAKESEQELEEAKKQLAAAAAEDKAKWQHRVSELEDRYHGACEDLTVATEQKLQVSQLTKVGRIYIISNIGTFGEPDSNGVGVYKIGETQRDHEVRVKELGGASVPFEFDIHAVIETKDSIGLERSLHKSFAEYRVNKMNMRKEFFRVNLNEIKRVVDNLKEGEDYTHKLWTEEARAALWHAKQWKETRDIESNPEKLKLWKRNSAGRQVGSDDSMS